MAYYLQSRNLRVHARRHFVNILCDKKGHRLGFKPIGRRALFTRNAITVVLPLLQLDIDDGIHTRACGILPFANKNKKRVTFHIPHHTVRLRNETRNFNLRVCFVCGIRFVDGV